MHRHRTHDRNSLLLTAGKGRRIILRFFRQINAREELVRLRVRLLLGHMPGSDRGECDILADSFIRKQVEVLEDHPHLFPDLVDVDREVCDLLPVKEDISLRRTFEQVHAA